MSAPAENGTNPEVFDIGFKLRQRLREMHEQKENTQGKIGILTEQLQRMYARAPKKTRDTQRQMDDKIARLEYKRTSVSLSLSEEKQLLRQIDIIKRSKKNLEDSQIHERSIQEKKGELSGLRDNLRSMLAQIAELQSALSKVELAKRLGCTTTDLKTLVLDCPKDKIGQIIGKSGSSLKQLEKRTGVQIDVDKHGSKIHLQGSEAALNAAVREVENVTLAVEVDVELTVAIVNYLIAKRSAILSKLQKAHPAVYFDVSRGSTKIHLRGLPDNVELAKVDIKTLDVKTVTRDLLSKETGLVVGKGGATITNLSDSHDVSLNVNDKDDGEGGSILEVTGPRSNVDNAMDEIEEILYNNAEVEEYVFVEPMQRNMFLNNTAAVLKKTQKDIANEAGKGGGGVLLIFDRNDEDRQSKSDPSKLIIKTSRSMMPKAKEIVLEKIKAFEATVSSITVDPSMIPAIIGKGGATIKELRKDGVEIEVYKESGLIKIQSEDDDAKVNVAEAIENIVAENQTMNVAINKSLIGLMFGDVGKSMRSKIIDDIGVKIIIDSSDEFVTLRGTVEKNNEAADIINEFIKNNFTVEFNVPPEDTSMLLHGGSENYLSTLASSFDVSATLRFSKNTVIVRGLQENVDNAVGELNRYIFGGDGIMVYKMRIPESAVGFVIGKGGAHISKVEKKYEGISLDVVKSSNQISMRGPVEMVKKCRSYLVLLLATTKVTDTIRITHEQHDILAKAGTMARISDGSGVEVTLADLSVKLRGISTDIKAVHALIMEQLNGKFEVSVDLLASQLSAVKKLAQDPTHFARIRDFAKVTLTVDSNASCIVLSGKRAGVKKAKNQVMMLLDCLCPGQFLRVKLPKAVLKAVTQPVTLGNISAETGATLLLDRELSCVLIISSEPSEVQAAESLLKIQTQKCEKLNIVVQLDSSDSWLISWLISKCHATIQSIQTDIGCKIIIDRSDLTISIIGKTEEVATQGKTLMDKIIRQRRKECIFIDIPESAMPSFIGKNGANIQMLSDKSHARIERLKKDPFRLQIQGNEEAVNSARALVSNWISAWESKNKGQPISVPQFIISFLTEKNSSLLTSIQQETQTKVDIDRKQCILTVRGGSASSRSKAIEKINKIVQLEKSKSEKSDIESAKQGINVFNQAQSPGVEREEEGKKSREQNSRVQLNGNHSVSNALPLDNLTKDKGLLVSHGKLSKNFEQKANGEAKKSCVNGSASKGTQASQSLFNLLVSDSAEDKPDGWGAPVGNNAPRSGDVSNEDQPKERSVLPETKVYKSSSGFSVRV